VFYLALQLGWDRKRAEQKGKSTDS